MSDLSQLEVFVRVVDAGSFTAAAEQLGVSKSHVSRQVSALEDRLGARLLNRTTRRVTPTDVGNVFHERCARILEELVDAEAAVTSLQTRPRGLLRLSVPVSFGIRYVAEAVADFMLEHPELEVDVQFSDRVVDLVDDAFDLAVRIGRLADSSMIARKLAASSSHVCASSDYLERHGAPQGPEDLRDHACLLYAYQFTGSTSWQLEGSGREVTVHVTGPMVSNNAEAMIAAACRGLGLVFIPDLLLVDEVKAGRLVPVLPGWSAEAAVWAVYPHHRHLSAKVRLFVDALAERFASPPWAGLVDAVPSPGARS
jgi:DNA-binding transcriptional LysR family regulator